MPIRRGVFFWVFVLFLLFSFSFSFSFLAAVSDPVRSFVLYVWVSAIGGRLGYRCIPCMSWIVRGKI